MSYNQKASSSGGPGSGMGGGTQPPPIGQSTNNTQHLPKTLAGLQHVQNLTHGQNPISQTTAGADLSTFFQQQRFNILKQQSHQFLQQNFQQQILQQYQQQNKERSGVAGSTTSGGVTGEPLALTRSPAATAELLNKTYQQHQQQANGSAAVAAAAAAVSNPALNQFQQQLQALPSNLMQQLQAFQYQIQQQQQQQHQQYPTVQQPSGSLQQAQVSGGSTPTTGTVAASQQHSTLQQQQQQKTFQQIQQIQQRYLSAAVAASAQAVSGSNKFNSSTSSAGSTPGPGPTALTSNSTINQLKTPNLPASTHITPVPSSGCGSLLNSRSSPNPSTVPMGVSTIGPSKHVPTPSISVLPAGKSSTASSNNSASSPSPAHQQTKSSTSRSSPISKSSTSGFKGALNSQLSKIGTQIKLEPSIVTDKISDTTGNKVPSGNEKSSQQKLSTTISRAAASPPKSTSETKTASTTEVTVKTGPNIVKNTEKSEKKESGNDEIPDLNAVKGKIASETVTNNPSDEIKKIEEKGVSLKDNEAPHKENIENSDTKASEIKTDNPAKTYLSPKTEKPNEVLEKLKTNKPAKLISESKDEKTGANLVTAVTESKDIDLSEKISEKKLSVDNSSGTNEKSSPNNLKKEKKPNDKESIVNNEMEIKSNSNLVTDIDVTNDNPPKKDLENIKNEKIVKDEQREENVVETTKHIGNIEKQEQQNQHQKDSMDTTESTSTKSIGIVDNKNQDNSTSSRKTARQPKNRANTLNIEKSTAEKNVKVTVNRGTASVPSETTVRKKNKPKQSVAPSTPKDNGSSNDSNNSRTISSDRKSQRHRLKTILYQSPLPELAYITKLSASEASNSPKPMTGTDDRLTVFYKNEYLAVRNAEGTFYLCQTMQNVYRTSPRISIRWLDSKDDSTYIPDFYDHTDIECVLTTVDLKRVDKTHLRLPKTEKTRIENILKKAIDVEKGIVPKPELTEENPDGLDLSLYKDESQIEKKSVITNVISSSSPGTGTGSARKSRRTTVAKENTKSGIGSSPETKRKRTASISPVKVSYQNKRKSSSAKKNKLTICKKKDKSDAESSEETDEADAEYHPSRKRHSKGQTGSAKTASGVQKSPLTKAGAVSPTLTPTTSRSKIVPEKIISITPSSRSRSERANKRKAIDTLSIMDNSNKNVTNVKTSTNTTNNVAASKNCDDPSPSTVNTSNKPSINAKNKAIAAESLSTADIAVSVQTSDSNALTKPSSNDNNTNSLNADLTANIDNATIATPTTSANNTSVAVTQNRPTRSRK